MIVENQPMRDPFTHPFCREEDLGLAIPDSDHAVSVCLPRWDHVIGYEEGNEQILDTFECGYPRFVAHPNVAELFLAAQSEFAKTGEAAIVFPSLAAAWRCGDYIKRRIGVSSRLESYGWKNVTALLFEERAYETAWKCWQHGGEIISSRFAETVLTDEPLEPDEAMRGREAREEIRVRIAGFHEGVEAKDVYLFSSGMAAIFALHRVATAASPGMPTLQIEFPYLDSFKVQDQFGEGGVVDISNTDSGGLNEVEAWLSKHRNAAAVFSELPSNPLLRTGNWRQIAPLLKEREIPLILDDTVATAVNVDGLRFADAITTSLTKAFSGEGDVAAGSVVLNPDSPFYELFSESMAQEEAASPLFERDAVVLEVNSRHFEERVAATNENASLVVDWLRGRREVKELWYPDQVSRTCFDDVRRDEGGFGGLFSLELKGGEDAARKFYDQVELSKGPSLGTNFSLICPYTLLAHYNELEWAAERGVSKNLLRFWIGLEDTDDLLQRIESALPML